MFNMMLASAIFATVVTIAVIVSFRERPGVPICGTNESNNEPSEAERPSLTLMEQLKVCMDNKAYIFTGIGTCGVILHMYVFTTLIG